MSVEDPRSSVLSFLERYNNAFYARDIAALQDCYTEDHVRFWDNHAGCDSDDLPAHLAAVQAFFDNGTIEQLEIDAPQVWFHGETATLTATLRYASSPKPGVRSTFCLKMDKGSWRAFHVHHSFDPNEA
ncbi:YybH family protein [Donghicola mangrovi]|uniref:YybH family protein n=1 Tax=Donghicola mangrovi TaxID=2729614 RepID=UPI001D15C69D|nr:nuclear transport factor 2 family protein [Donghicola mangrovi]